MILDRTTAAYIQNVAKTAAKLGLDRVIIEPGKVRAIGEDNSILMMHTRDVPTLPFVSLGMNRLDVLAARYDLVKDRPNQEVSAVPDDEDNPTYARSLKIKAKGVSAEYRCANPAMIKIPRELADTDAFVGIFSSDAYDLISSGASSMDAEEVIITGDSTGISCEMTDVAGCKATLTLSETKITPIDGGVDEDDDVEHSVSFTHKYNVKQLRTVLKDRDDESFIVTTKGIMIVTVNGIDINLIPRR